MNFLQKKWRGTGIALALMTLVAACGTKPPPRLYVMAPPEADATSLPVEATLRVTLPAYLERPQIVVRRNTYHLVPNDDDQWAEPLDKATARLLAEELSRKLTRGKVVVGGNGDVTAAREYLITLDAFEPLDSGQVLLSGRWQLRDAQGGKNLASGTLHQLRNILGKDPTAMVAAMSEALTAVAQEIAGVSNAKRGVKGLWPVAVM